MSDTIQDNIAEGVISAVQVIVDNAIKTIKNDQTITASIVEADAEDKTKYYVSTGSLEFYAYSDGDKQYKEKDDVYVLIPQGDYTQRKLIINAVSSNVEDTESQISANRLIDYIPVFQRKEAIQLTTEVVEGVKEIEDLNYHPYTLWDDMEQPLGNRKFDYFSLTITPAEEYDLTDDDDTEEDFNVEEPDDNGDEEAEETFAQMPEESEENLDLSTPSEEEEEGEDEEVKASNDFGLYIKLPNEEFIMITSDDLRGNINYLTPEIGYEFIYPCTFEPSDTFGLFLAQVQKQMKFNIEISMGYSKSNSLINSNKVVLYDNGEEFSYNASAWRQNNTKVQAEVFGKEYNIIASKYEPVNYITDILVFRYCVGVKNDLAGDNWEEIGRKAYTTVSRFVDASWISDSGVIDFGAAKKFFGGAETTKFKICYKINDEEHEAFSVWSDIIEFSNKKVNKSTTVVTGQKIKLSLKDGDNGIYNYYGLDNHLKVTPTTNEFTVQVKTSSDEELVKDGDYIDRVKSITWLYPISLTGLEIVTERSSDENDKKVYIKGFLEPTEQQTDEIVSGKWGDIFYYKIKSTCYPNWTNNKIKCIVEFTDDTKETAEINLEFGGYKNNNTPYSLNIDIDNDDKYLKNGQILKLKTQFERVDGTAAVLPEDGWKWEWVNKGPMLFCDKHGSVLNNTDSVSDGKSYIGKATDEIYITLGDVGTYSSRAGVIKLTIPKTQVNDVATQDIVAYLPVPFLYRNENGYAFQGPDRVIYDGINDYSYDNSNIQLYHNGEVVDMTLPTLMDRNGIIWGVYDQSEQANVNRDRGSHILCYAASPTETDDKVNEVKLVPVTSSSINAEAFVNVIIIKDKTSNTVLWEQPIITYRNVWTNEDMYGWNGKDPHTGNNGIYSPFIAAGELNSNNAFTGVMLGKCKMSNDGGETYGLFGQSEGDPRFYLTQQGELYIGNGAKNGAEHHYIEVSKEGELHIKVQDFNLTIDDNNYIKLNSKGQLAIKVSDSFELLVPHLRIDSESSVIKVYEDVNNARVRASFGLVKDNVYGLDIYNGAFVIYENYTQDDTNKIFYTQTTNNGLAEIYFKGRLQGEYTITDLPIKPNDTTNNSAITNVSINNHNYSFTNWHENISINSGLNVNVKYQDTQYTDSLYVGCLIPKSIGKEYENNYDHNGYHFGVIAKGANEKGKLMIVTDKKADIYIGSRTNLNSYVGDYIDVGASFSPNSIKISSGKYGEIASFSYNTSYSSRQTMFHGRVEITGSLEVLNGSLSTILTSEGDEGYQTYYYRPIADKDDKYKYSIGTNNIKTMEWKQDTSKAWVRCVPIGVGPYGVDKAFGIDIWQSDQKLKTNIVQNKLNQLNTILQIQHYGFDWKDSGAHIELGYIAQQLETIIPDAILNVPQANGEVIKQIRTSSILPYITKAIQELNTEITVLKQEIKELKQNEIYK